MEKVWLFVEGDTEEIFISSLIRGKLYMTFQQEKDLSIFVQQDLKNSTHHRIYCENCGSVDKIPHRINEMYYLIEASQTRHIVVVCDVEKLNCYSKRKGLIENKLDEHIDKSLIRYVFFNPMIESSYWECPRVIEKIVELEYKKKFGIPIASRDVRISSPGGGRYSPDDIKKYFKKYNLKYRETHFAKEFFPRVDFETCPNQVLSRILNFLHSI